MASELLIPEFLCGRKAVVKRNSRRVVCAAAKAGSFKTVLASESFISIDDAPSHIILDDLMPEFDAEYIQLAPFGAQFSEVTYSSDRGAWYLLNRTLLWETLDEFWMSLAILAESHVVLPLMSKTHDPRRADDCRYVLKKLLRWWPEFRRMDDRFYDGVLQPQPWYRWGRATWGLLRAMDREEVIDELKSMDAEDAGELLKIVSA